MVKPDKGDEDVGGVVRAATQNILAHPEQASLKRVAWAYGCSKVGSEDEAQLLRLMCAKIAALPGEGP